MRRLSRISERLQAENTIPRVEDKKFQERQEKKVERQSRERFVLKAKVIIATDKIRKTLVDAAAASKAKKEKKAPNQGKVGCNPMRMRFIACLTMIWMHLRR